MCDLQQTAAFCLSVWFYLFLHCQQKHRWCCLPLHAQDCLCLTPLLKHTASLLIKLWSYHAVARVFVCVCVCVYVCVFFDLCVIWSYSCVLTRLQRPSQMCCPAVYDTDCLFVCVCVCVAEGQETAYHPNDEGRFIKRLFNSTVDVLVVSVWACLRAS